MTELMLRSYWFLRHGQTDWNAANLSQGRTDVPLNDAGLAQAVAAGKAFARHFQNHSMPFTRIVTSPLSRASVTADYVKRAITEAGGPDLPITRDDSMIEVCFGVQEGKPMGEWYNPWIAGDYTPEGAEPFAELRERVVKGLNRILAGDETTLIVAHGGVFRSLRSAMNLPANVRLPNAVPVFAHPEAGQWSLDIEETD
ncbi:histidine phosphatase family protein [Acetobacteraceae bacterium ESL0709]|nr:histidine phosphatase family protein [Acetobacteraceae bacterium ESL0697]MDF7678990.1 histidine phosphatase family protein [Acetobacteraceae bacterium ESL0709]